jgi:hypothetical protein
MSTTYAGSTLSLVAALPATYDQAGYEALTFVAGACALADVPPLMRDWSIVTEPLVCKTTDTDKKGSAKWAPVPFKLSGIVADAAQAIFITLEASATAVGSFKLALTGAETLYFTAMVSKFANVDGGDQNTIHTRSGTLLIQSDDITRVDPS